MTNYVGNIYMVTEECCTCGMAFAITQDFEKRRLKDHNWFYCPAGHRQHYTGKSEEQKLKAKLAEKEQELERQREVSSEIKAQASRIAKNYQRMCERVKNGVCPCCNRTFENLLRHMKTKHPEYGEHSVLKQLRETYGLTQADLANEIGISANYISFFERERPMPACAKAEIEEWIAQSA